ncbi:MAG: DinB family protein [Bacillota bacterium]|nr:DinB family protein [Bacillota bacterium]
MISVAKQWNPKQALLKSIIFEKDKFHEAMSLTIELHSMIHSSEMSGVEVKTFEDEIWDKLNENAISYMPTNEDVTIAWNIWHITRIEDITSNILIAGQDQVINSDNWIEKMNVKISDTGNAMKASEIMTFSESINVQQLRNYRIDVGRRTREIISGLKPEDLKEKIESPRLQRVLTEGGVLEVEDSIWLLDFWGKKNVAGILLMPITRHQVVHINDSLKLKEKYSKKLK